jgi:hypothetical protein
MGKYNKLRVLLKEILGFSLLHVPIHGINLLPFFVSNQQGTEKNLPDLK